MYMNTHGYCIHVVAYRSCHTRRNAPMLVHKNWQIGVIVHTAQQVCIVVACVYCCCLVCVLILCVFVYYVSIAVFFFYFRCRTAGQKSIFGRSCERPPRHRFFLVSLCLNANAEMVPKIPSCHYMLLMQPSRLKFSSNQFHVLHTCKIITATG